MPKIHDLSTSRAKRVRMTSRFAVGVIIATAVVVVGTTSFTSHGDWSTAALGDASATTRATALMATKSSMAVGDPASSADPSRGFDYFPDHYVNQAREPAEPIATF
ncbi:MAG TPA: hypothetical protein VGN65_09980 [Casimicrobiaceae bacterium]